MIILVFKFLRSIVYTLTKNFRDLYKFWDLALLKFGLTTPVEFIPTIGAFCWGIQKITEYKHDFILY